MATVTIPKILANFETSLNAKISTTAPTLTLNTSVDDDGTTLSGTYSLTIDEGTTSEEHMIVTLAGSAGTITRRGLSRVDAWTEVAGNKIEHNRGASVKITNVSAVNIQRLLAGTDTFDSVNWTGISSISGLATPTSSETTKVANVAYVNSISAAGSVDSSTAAKGVGKSSYAHNKSLGTATITIATPGVVSLTAHGLVAGDTVLFTTDGALPTGITASTNYYVISAGLTADAFQIAATSGGTAIDTSGSQSGTHTLFRMTPFFVSDVDPRLPTQSENDALVGTSGTPSSSNKYVTNDDTTGTGSVLRSSVLTYLANFGGSGADGALNVTSGTTTIDLGSAANVVKNYTSINVSAGATLAFSNPHTQGTLIVLRSQGNVTIAGTIDGQSLGGAGGTGGTGGVGAADGTSGTSGTDNDEILDTNNHAGLLGVFGQTTGTAGTGGASVSAYTTTGSNRVLYSVLSQANVYKGIANVVPGPGGAGGGGGGGVAGNNGGAGGNGGRGGGAFYIECAGAWNFTGTISVAGQNGSNGTSVAVAGSGGGGGGGGGGMLYVLYKTLTANSGTVTKTGGTGGTGGTSSGSAPRGGGGGSGSGGASLLGAGGAGSSGAGGGTGGSSGSGGAGGSGGASDSSGSAGSPATGSGGGGGSGAGGGGGGGGSSLIAQLL